MVLPSDPEKYRRQWNAGSGVSGTKPVKPQLKGEWNPGMPCHWMEITARNKIKCYLVRVFSVLQLAAGIVYLQFRARETIGIFESSKKPAMLIYQILFFILEVISVFAVFFRFFELWKVCFRNCVDFKQIPNDMLETLHRNERSTSDVRQQFSNYPSIGVFIPCYNEEADLVLETLLGALNIDYPKELLTIYLCDDGKDPMKRNMVSQLRREHKNIHYVIRPDNSHAKAGNLNYSLARTKTDLIVTLDADFVARPNLVQRLLPYYYVWNSEKGLYEFNETLAVVQTPQHFRNLSPYDSDPLDQRSTFFFELVLPGKDWFNASTMIGTTNLLSRKPLEEAGYYPYYSITEDTAMSLAFHSLGYRTYYVNESLATGLATTSLWSNLGQRARWLKGDWQILFSKNGPVVAKGLNIIQRILYFHMAFARIISVIHLLYDFCAILLLIGGIAPLDATEPLKFIIYLSAFLIASVLNRTIVVFGGIGLEKSESATVAFEAIFRYTTVKGIFIALFRGQNLKFKVTDKSGVGIGKKVTREEKKKTLEGLRNGNQTEIREFREERRETVLGEGFMAMKNSEYGAAIDGSAAQATDASGDTSTSSGQEETISYTASEDDTGRAYKKPFRSKTPEERAQRVLDMKKNLKRVWFNGLMSILLIVSITYAIIRPPNHLGSQIVIVNGVRGRFVHKNILPIAMALGFAVMNLLPHLLAIYLCFIPYTSGWMMRDLVHGRCDQYAVHPKTGKLFVPWSFISLLSVVRMIIMFGSIGVLVWFTISNGGPEFVEIAEN